MTFEAGFGGRAGGGGLGPMIKKTEISFNLRKKKTQRKKVSPVLFTKTDPVPISSSLHVGG